MNRFKFLRRLLVPALTLLSGLASAGTLAMPHIVFMHGNGDSAALWQTTIWRFESNGWPRERLHAVNVAYPQSRDVDSVPQPGRNSAAENSQALADVVAQVRQLAGKEKVVLMANSRGGNAVRSFIANGGEAYVSHAILGGTPNHGVWAIKGLNEGNEFAGTGPFLTGLNAPKNAAGDEVKGPVQWMTIRSDGNDKFAQPDGLWMGAKGMATNVTAEGPALRGAQNVVLPAIDHRETAYGPQAFAAAYQFITGLTPVRSDFLPEATVELRGMVSGLGVRSDDPTTGNVVNNLPLIGARLEVFATDAMTGERIGAALLQTEIGVNGAWGPLRVASTSALEFVVSAPSYASTHYYRSAFPRSSQYVHLIGQRMTDADKAAGAIVRFTRPRGYFDLGRDKLSFDGQVPPGLPPSGAGLAVSTLKIADAPPRSVVGEFNGERIVGRTWSAAQGHLVVLELTR